MVLIMFGNPNSFIFLQHMISYTPMVLISMWMSGTTPPVRMLLLCGYHEQWIWYIKHLNSSILWFLKLMFISLQVTNAYLQLFKGLGAKVTLGFIKEMPKTSNALIKFDIDRFSNRHPLLCMGYFTTIPCTHVWSIACQDLFTVRQNLVTNFFLLFSACYGYSDRERALTILRKTEEPKRFCFEKSRHYHLSFKLVKDHLLSLRNRWLLKGFQLENCQKVIEYPQLIRTILIG